MENETWKQGPNKDVDVVVVLSESLFMKSIGFLMPSFIQNLEDELKNQRLSPRFGLVGFSGKPPVHRPGHVHTIKGTFFGSAKAFAGGLKNMEFLTRLEQKSRHELIPCFEFFTLLPEARVWVRKWLQKCRRR